MSMPKETLTLKHKQDFDFGNLPGFAYDSVILDIYDDHLHITEKRIEGLVFKKNTTNTEEIWYRDFIKFDVEKRNGSLYLKAVSKTGIGFDDAFALVGYNKNEIKLKLEKICKKLNSYLNDYHERGTRVYSDSLPTKTNNHSMFCKHCGKQITTDSVFCKYCGGKQS